MEHIIPEAAKQDYEKAKWCLWHGNPEKALSKLKNIQSMVGEDKKSIMKLITYIKNNMAHIVNYQKREISGQIFTSQLAESTVNNLVNVMQKQDKRMQWSRDGADSVLQIRSSKQSRNWGKCWQLVQSMMYREAIYVN